MSRIEKLGIRGIRSFGPDEMRKLEFYSPLTLILGQNGCGKTTIIESLKFITTGEAPPGCGRGAAFVHDPKVAKDTVVRGQIKLVFKSTKGKPVTVCRSVEVTQKPKTLMFNSIDSVISYKGPDGKEVSVSNKCVDFHAEVTSLLGVAKPILDNVIFCHQEDSNWPLDEGKKVKDKFDSIFNATRYIKCLDTIRKLRKDKMIACNNMRETIEALKAMKEQADLLRRDLKDLEKNRKELEDEQTGLAENEKPIRKRLREIMEIEREISNIGGEISGKKHQLNSIREMQRELRAAQTEVVTCSDSELINLIMDFERNAQIKETKKNEVDVKLRRLKVDIEALKKTESKSLLHMGKLEAAHTTHLDNVAKGNVILNDLVLEYKIEGYKDQSEFTVDEAKNVLMKVDNFFEGERAKSLQKKKEFEMKEAEMQKQLDDLRSEETTLVHDIDTLTKQIEECTRKSRQLRQQLASNEEELSSISLEDLKKSLDEIIRRIQEEENRVSVPETNKEIEKKRGEREEIERELDDVKKKVAKMNRLAAAKSQYDIHLKHKQELEQKNQLLKRRNADDFESLFGGPVGDNIKNELEARMTSIRRQIRESREGKNKHERKKTELGTKIENEKQIIGRLDKDIEAYESKLESICSGTNLEAAIVRTKEQIDYLLKKKGDQESSTVMFRGFLDKVKGGEGCPLCHRDFEGGYDKEMLVDEIQGKLNRLPYELTELKKTLLEKESLYERLIQLQPQKEGADKASKDLQDRKEKLKRYHEEFEKSSREWEQSSQHLSSLVSEEEIAQRVHSDVVSIDANIRSIRQISDKISNIQATLGASDDDLSMDELVKVQSDLERKAKLVRGEIERLQETLMEHSNNIKRLNDRKIALSTKELELKKKEQETESIKKEIEKLGQEKISKEELVEDLQVSVAPIKFQLKEKVSAKKNLALEKESALEEYSRKINLIRENLRYASEIQEMIRRYVEEHREKILLEAKKRVQAIQTESEEKEKSKKELQEECNSILKELTMQKEKKRGLEDERKIREKEREAMNLDKTIKELEEKIQKSDYEKVFEEKNNLIVKENQILKRKAILDGRLEELSKKRKDLEGNLKQERVRNAEKNYKDKFIEKKCIEVACSDLNKYYRALDTAVMKFHQEKMSNINSIIRELWRTTYKGNDIDYIEIKTDESDSQGADKRRVYNYRVVMIKNEVEMDMRARCSAGQKVLASLIIRMALAETFSSHCGILALDEPTTNLDKENIEALSLALLNIVNKRSHQRNLQLIVITHDEDFMERMTRADFIEHYYKISRDGRGLSVITRKLAHAV